jgi:hypothetical protein
MSFEGKTAVPIGRFLITTYIEKESCIYEAVTTSETWRFSQSLKGQ